MQRRILTAAITLALTFIFLNSLAAQQGSTTTKPSSSKTGSSSGNSTTSKTASSSTAKAPSQPLALTTDKDKVSYAIGMNIGQNMKMESVDIDPDVLSRGLKDALSGGKTLMTEAEAQQTLTKFRNDMIAKKQAERQKQGDSNKQQGEQFLAANKTKEGVVTLPSGLQYKILKEGTGAKPTATDSVTCNYRGALIDGTEFDSSYKRGEPASFGVSQVIKGWTEGLQLMPVGSKWQLFIPSDLAYGANGAGQQIGPNATLIFDVELLSIKEQASSKPQSSGEPASKPDSQPNAQPSSQPKSEATPQPTKQ
jgi:FKBP-type peptidyl-prolyl cis-trans isomerase